ncbi:MAG: hypothetical protein JST63_15650 [Bacteroidetes bacterium]|nr:hypothetical protein [Bacteroidota bacterium]
MKYRKYIYVKLLFLFVLAKCDLYAQHTSGNLILQFENRVGERLVNFDSIYENSLGEQLRITKFRYYISNIKLSDSTMGKNYKCSNRYFLVDENKLDSKTISLKLPPGRYNKISFLLGVDSLRNVSGIQTGALDPLNDMFWTWKSGYVMAKLEGRSPSSSLQHHLFEYHIGGFSGIYNVTGRVILSLPAEINIVHGKESRIVISADIDKWFSAVYRLSISDHPACTVTGQLAKQFSENYLQMFTVQSLTP